MGDQQEQENLHNTEGNLLRQSWIFDDNDQYDILDTSVNHNNDLVDKNKELKEKIDKELKEKIEDLECKNSELEFWRDFYQKQYVALNALTVSLRNQLQRKTEILVDTANRGKDDVLVKKNLHQNLEKKNKKLTTKVKELTKSTKPVVLYDNYTDQDIVELQQQSERYNQNWIDSIKKHQEIEKKLQEYANDNDIQALKKIREHTRRVLSPLRAFYENALQQKPPKALKDFYEREYDIYDKKWKKINKYSTSFLDLLRKKN